MRSTARPLQIAVPNMQRASVRCELSWRRRKYDPQLRALVGEIPFAPAINSWTAVQLCIPTMPNAIPERSRTAFRDNSEHLSERSDAGLLIVHKVFGIVKESVRSGAQETTLEAGMGAGGRGRRLRPLPFSTQRPRARLWRSVGLPLVLRIESPRISIR